MTTVAEKSAQQTSVQASKEMQRVRQKALRRQRFNRGLVYLLAILICLWVLVPIWFIGSMALTTPETVRAYPKGVLPFIPFSFETMRFFLNSEGIIPGIVNSIVVAVITLVLSTIIAAPAGYALSRYIFPGRDFFRLSILAVRAFPIVVLAIPLAYLGSSLGEMVGIYGGVAAAHVLGGGLSILMVRRFLVQAADELPSTDLQSAPAGALGWS